MNSPESDCQHRQPPMRTVSVAPKVVHATLPAIMPAVVPAASSSTSVFSIPSFKKSHVVVLQPLNKFQSVRVKWLLFCPSAGPSSVAVPPVAGGESVVLFADGKERKTRNSQNSGSAGMPLLKFKEKSKKSKCVITK